MKTEKSEQRKKEDCELLDLFATQREQYSHCDFKEALHQFKQDNDLLPKNVSGWYLSNKYIHWCVYYDYYKNIYYGTNGVGSWFTGEFGNLEPDTDEIPATQQQVEERLFPFFEKMYPKGTRVKCLMDDSKRVVNGKFVFGKSSITENVYAQILNSGATQCIMKDGILAELIEESEVDKLKAEIRKLSDKLKELGE